jgi:transcriptional regulator with XRE-family HTH domain
MPTKTKTRPASTSRRSISEQLRGSILDRGLTAYRLGREAGIDPGLIQRFINGERDIRMKTADALAEARGLRLAEGARGRGRPLKAGRSVRAVDVEDDRPADGDRPEAAPDPS